MNYSLLTSSWVTRVAAILFACHLSLAASFAARLKDGTRVVQLSDGTRLHVGRCVAPQRKQLPALRTNWRADRVYRVPVILVSFLDQDFSMANPQETYDNLLNRTGYNMRHGPGCAADYFLAQSGGMFHVQFDVVGPVKLQTSCKLSSKTNYGSTQLRSAAQLADSLLNYADYDWDGQGSVAQVAFIYAGYGGNEDSDKVDGRIWPNTGSFSTLTADGVKVRNYTASAELWTNDQLCGIGTFLHEFSHSLGLPDFYPTGGSEYSVVDEWDLMDGGNFSDDGWCPPNYSVHEKELLGWFSSTELLTTQAVRDLPTVADGGAAFRVTNSGLASEYYLLENRQQQGWDAYLPGHGLTVTHVDFSQSVWAGNTVNNTASHHRMDLIHASGRGYHDDEALYDGKGHFFQGRNLYLSGSAFPYVTDTQVVDELTDTSEPAATLFNANAEGVKFMGKPIKGIQESADGLVSFDFYENQETGVREIPSSGDRAATIYNLNGQRLRRVSRSGIYLVGNKKQVAR